MKISELRLPLVALLLACVASVAMLVTRTVLTRHFHSLYLAGNLFLGCIPLFFALALARSFSKPSSRAVKVSLFLGWLVFFPNAPYILTDLVHLKSGLHPQFWTDLGLLVLFAWCGAFAGFLSLYIVQRLVIARRGKLAGWAFVGAVAVLTGVGIYLGRFERWNSWDIAANPLGLFRSLCSLASEALTLGRPARFIALFGAVVFIGHVTLYSLLGAPALNANGPSTGDGRRAGE
jgi:uncharacterized membrane protein